MAEQFLLLLWFLFQQIAGLGKIDSKRNICANNTSLRKVARGSLNDAKQHFDSIECTVGNAYREILFVFFKGILKGQSSEILIPFFDIYG